MARRGRKPKPTRLKVIEGNRGKRPLPEEPEPSPVQEVPQPPDWLLAEGKREWRRLAEELGQVGLLTRVDLSMLAVWCQVWARYHQAETHGKGASASLIAQLRHVAAEFGLTPASRPRLVRPKEDGRDASRLLS